MTTNSPSRTSDNESGPVNNTDSDLVMRRAKWVCCACCDIDRTYNVHADETAHRSPCDIHKTARQA